VEHGFGQAAAVYKRLHKSRWQLTYAQLTDEIGAHALVSITLLRTLARFAEDVSDDVDWADARSAIFAQRDIRVRGEDTNGSLAGIPRYKWCIPRDVAVASDAFCVSSKDVRRIAGLNRKSRATLPEATRSRGPLGHPKFDDQGEPIWVAYEPCPTLGTRNPVQEEVDIIGERQHNRMDMWFYLGASSTDLRAEYTHDLGIMVPNPHSHPFPKQHNAVSRQPRPANSARHVPASICAERNAQQMRNMGVAVQDSRS
jgi:hypothetical protein